MDLNSSNLVVISKLKKIEEFYNTQIEEMPVDYAKHLDS